MLGGFIINYNTYRDRASRYTEDEVVSFGEWVLWLAIVTLVPIYGIIHVFITACGQGKKESMRNFARAYLIFVALLFIVFMFLTTSITHAVLGAVQWMF